MELFKLMTKTDIVHVPYRATTGAMADLMGGRIDMGLFGQSSAKAQVEGGKLRGFAIASPQRSPLMPQVPTMTEAGLPGFEVQSWFGMLAPAKTPQAIVDRLAQRNEEGFESIRNSSRRLRRRACRSSRRRRTRCCRRCARFEEMGRRDPGDRHDDQSMSAHCLTGS